MPRTTVFLFLLSAFAPFARADVKLPAIFGDGMVLQRADEVPVWGRSAPGAVVELRGSWLADAVTATADDAGAWRVTVPTGAAGGPHTLRIEGGGEPVVREVWFGEVWFCSGQSNMAWPLRESDGGQEAIASAADAQLRLFTVANAESVGRALDCQGSWVAASPETAAESSAVAYYFGRELRAELGVPVGLIDASWGGTPIEAWISGLTLRQMPEFKPSIARMDGALRTRGQPSLDARRADWWRRLTAVDPGLRESWMSPSLDEDDWKIATLPASWKDLGFEQFDGCVWFRRTIEPPPGWAGRDLVLELGPIDDFDMIFLNGEVIGSTRQDGHWRTPRTYEIPGDRISGAALQLTVLAIDTGGAGRLGSAPEGMRLRLASTGPGDGLPLAGEWKMRRGAALGEIGTWPRDSWFTQNHPAALFNGMVAPVAPYGIRGALWYQGEANVPRAQQYRALLPALIADWRGWWERGDFPFYYVQIAPFAYEGDVGQAAELREAQALAQDVANVGMVVTMDIGDPTDIHPRDKHTVGLRLAQWALSETYGRADVPCRGPSLDGMHLDGSEVHLTFQHGAGLVAEGGEPGPFIVAGPDRVFHPPWPASRAVRSSFPANKWPSRPQSATRGAPPTAEHSETPRAYPHRPSAPTIGPREQAALASRSSREEEEEPCCREPLRCSCQRYPRWRVCAGRPALGVPGTGTAWRSSAASSSSA